MRKPALRDCLARSASCARLRLRSNGGWDGSASEDEPDMMVRCRPTSAIHFQQCAIQTRSRVPKRGDFLAYLLAELNETF